MFFSDTTGPLYNLENTNDIRNDTWTWWEKIFFLCRLYMPTHWWIGHWNSIDAVMILCFWVSFISRFLIPSVDFPIVRILYSITLIIFYIRLLRIGYSIESIGPRVITILAMVINCFNDIVLPSSKYTFCTVCN